MNYVRAAFYLILAVCAIRVTMDLHQFMPHAEAALAGVQAIELNTTRTEAEMSGLLNTARHIATDERAQTNTQLAAARDLTSRGSKLLDDADAAVRDLDASAVGLGTIAPATNRAIAGIAADAHETLGAGTETLKAAAADLADPAIKNSLDDFSSSAANAKVATKEAAGAMADFHQVTTYEAKQIMAPISKAKAIALVATRFVGKFFGF